MKRVMLLFAAIIAILFISGCSQPYPPAADVKILEYSVESSESGYTADISYRDGQNDIIQLTDEPLPWTVSITLDDDFTGNAYLTAEVSEAQVFTEYMSGTVTSLTDNKLIDTAKNFSIAGVLEGDKVFKDPTSATSASVLEIESADTLGINFVLFSSVGDSYNIYHKKTLTSKIILNAETIDSDFEENVRILSTLVKETIDM